MFDRREKQLHRKMGMRPNNSKGVISTKARKRRMDELVEDAEQELRYWTR